MNNITRKILVIIILCLVSISVIELAVRGISALLKEENFQIFNKIDTKDKNDGNKQNEDSTKNSENVGYVEKNGTDLLISVDDYINLIYEKKYSAAYKLLKPDFRARFFPDITQFTQYAVSVFFGNNGKVAEIKYFDKIAPNAYLCKVRLQDFEPQPGDPVQTPHDDFFVIEYQDNKKYEISFKGFVGTKKINQEILIGKVKIVTKEVERYNAESNFIVDIFNGEDRNVSIFDKKAQEPNAGIVLVDNDKIMEHINKVDWDQVYISNTDFTIAPNETKTFTIPFNVLAKYEISKIQFNNILIGDETKKAEIIVR